MKKFCRYAVIDIQTGNLLVCGQKWKDFDSGNIRYIKSGVFKTFPLFWRTITEYFRTIEIKDIPCAIVYWVRNKGKGLYNCVTLSGFKLHLRARLFDLSGNDYPEVYRKLLAQLGVNNEST